MVIFPQEMRDGAPWADSFQQMLSIPCMERGKLYPPGRSRRVCPLHALCVRYRLSSPAVLCCLMCSVFPGEACDELGGEFCEPSYQEGVGKEVKQ